MNMDQNTTNFMKSAYQENLPKAHQSRDLLLEPKNTNFMKTTDQDNLSQAHQWKNTESYPETETEEMNQVRDRVIHNSRYHKKFQPQRPNEPSRGYTAENQGQQKFQRPPPNMEKTSIIEELNKVGFNQSYKTQEQLHEQETNRKAMKDIRESYMEKEQTNKEKLEAAYKTEIYHLKQEIIKQKQANMDNIERSLA